MPRLDDSDSQLGVWMQESFALAHLIQGTLSSIRLGRQLKIDLTDFIMSIGMKESKYKYSQYSSFQAAASKVVLFYVHHLLS